MTIPQQVAELIRQHPRTIRGLCIAVYGSAKQRDINAMRNHIHRARLIAPIVSKKIHNGATIKNEPVVIYKIEKESNDSNSN